MNYNNYSRILTAVICLAVLFALMFLVHKCRAGESFQLLGKEEFKKQSKLMTSLKTNDPWLKGMIIKPVIHYDETVMPPAYQDWQGALPGEIIW